MSVEEGFEDLTTPQMMERVAWLMKSFDAGSPAQVLYIFSHLNTITMSSLDDLMKLSANDLMNARNLIDHTFGVSG